MLRSTLSRLGGFGRGEFKFCKAKKQRFDLPLLVGRWEAGPHSGAIVSRPPHHKSEIDALGFVHYMWKF